MFDTMVLKWLLILATLKQKSAFEGSFFLQWSFQRLHEVDANWSVLGPKLFYTSTGLEVTDVEQLNANVTKTFYVGNEKLAESDTASVLDLFGDSWTSSAYRAAKNLASTQSEPIFFYEITQKPSKTFNDIIGPAYGSDKEDFGVGHVDDLFYIFDNVGGTNEAIKTNEDKTTREAITTLWTNFAKHFDPTPYHGDIVPTWFPLTAKEDNYLEIKADSEPKVGFRRTRMHLWNTLFWEKAENEILANAQPSSRSRSQLPSLGNHQQLFASQSKK